MNFLSRLFHKDRTPKEAVKTPAIDRPTPPGIGWRKWSSAEMSQDDVLTLFAADRVETWHRDHGYAIIKPREMHPAANVHDLWWRPFS